MGWNSANDIFDPVAQALIDAGAGADQLREVLGVLIRRLQSEDWDTEGESLERFQDNPIVVEVFAEQGIHLPNGPGQTDP